jgi:hypothetical protein
VEDADNRGGCGERGEKGCMRISAPSAQFCCECKIAVKNEQCFKIKPVLQQRTCVEKLREHQVSLQVEQRVGPQVDSGCSVQEKQEVYLLFTMSSKNHHPC